jgi:maleylpyruvate isomerase
MERSFADALRWMRQGTELFLDAVAGLDQDAYSADTTLPGWTRKHLIGHVAANADALGNLVHWAATGVETRMYASQEERLAGINRAVTMSAEALGAWLISSAEQLAGAMDRLTEEQWQRKVLTAQGRTVPAIELPWMRSREVNVHAVDLDAGVTFADLPQGFLIALTEEITAKRGLSELPDGPLPDVTAFLAGRPHTLTDAPRLGPWL